jgi:hypothetical protein
VSRRSRKGTPVWFAMVAGLVLVLTGCADAHGRPGAGGSSGSDASAEDTGTEGGLDAWAYCDPELPDLTAESCRDHSILVQEVERGTTETVRGEGVSFGWSTEERLVETDERVRSCRCTVSCRDACSLPSVQGVDPVCRSNHCILPCAADSDCPQRMRCVKGRDGHEYCSPVMPPLED